jgi:hypothetical protein
MDAERCRPESESGMVALVLASVAGALEVAMIVLPVVSGRDRDDAVWFAYVLTYLVAPPTVAVLAHLLAPARRDRSDPAGAPHGRAARIVARDTLIVHAAVVVLSWLFWDTFTVYGNALWL